MGDTLCEECSVLSFDDEIFKDFVGEDYIIPLRQGPDDEVNKRLNELLKLDYTRSDTFPDLPGLAASAEAGCAFCEVLREETLRYTLPEPSNITYRLRYLWSPPCASDGVGLYMLLAELTAKVDREGSDPYVRLISIAFSIESAQGTGRIRE